MDYRLATAQRGPDQTGKNAEAWKVLVIAPLRWFAAKIQKKNPDNWSKGIVTSPEEFQFNVENEKFVKKALRFANTGKSSHVKSHATDAFYSLRETSQGEAAMKINAALEAKGLL